MRNVIGILVVFLLSLSASGQLMPAEGARLNYRIVGFTFPSSGQKQEYTLEIARGNIQEEEDFKRRIVTTQKSNINKFVAEVPAFGCDYTWRVTFKNGSAANTAHVLHHFSTAVFDTSGTRFRVLHKAQKYRNAYVFLDCTRALYDMNGRIVWFLPDSQFMESADERIMDLKATAEGTITFYNSSGKAYEIDYNGKVLWSLLPGNSGGFTDNSCHHEFTRLHNGHYMALANEHVHWLLPGKADNGQLRNAEDSSSVYQDMMFGTVAEYDKKGDRIWSWKSAKYFEESDVRNRMTSEGKYDAEVHLNSFFFDERDSSVYLSFKNIDRILRIKYPEGKVLNAYGPSFAPGSPHTDGVLFCGQHSCRASSKGELYLFNNNNCHERSFPKLLIAKQPPPGDSTLELVWEYERRIMGITYNDGEGSRFAKGGNVIELPDADMFGSLVLPYSEVFIVGRNKKLLWSALPEKWLPDQKKWQIMSLYRASIITNHNWLEKIIWNH